MLSPSTYWTAEQWRPLSSSFCALDICLRRLELTCGSASAINPSHIHQWHPAEQEDYEIEKLYSCTVGRFCIGFGTHDTLVVDIPDWGEHTRVILAYIPVLMSIVLLCLTGCIQSGLKSIFRAALGIFVIASSIVDWSPSLKRRYYQPFHKSSHIKRFPCCVFLTFQLVSTITDYESLSSWYQREEHGTSETWFCRVYQRFAAACWSQRATHH